MNLYSFVNDAKRIDLRNCLLLFLFTVLLYMPSLRFSFVNFDDPLVLLSHPNLYNEKSFLSSLREILFNYFPREEPLIMRDITWAIDSRLFGFTNPFGYHLGNVILNGFNTVLLYMFLLLSTGRRIFSLLIAVTFSVHAIHAEPVCWIMGRKDVLVTFFMLLALIVQTLFLMTARREYYFLTVLLTLAALLSKINAATFFMVLAVHQIYFSYLNGSRAPDSPLDFKHILKVVFPGILPHLLISVLIFLWYKKILQDYGVFSEGMSSTSVGFGYLACFVPIIVSVYLKLIFFPFNYSAYYSFPNVNTELTPYLIVISVIIGLILIGMSLFLSVRRKDLFFYVLLFFFLMIPYFNIIGVGIWLANRYVYLSFFCVSAIIIGLCADFVKRQPKYKNAFLFVWICFISMNLFQTITYQQVWKNDHSLWKYEAGLKGPWILSFIYLASSHITLALEDTTPEGKTHHLNMADETIDAGMKHFGKNGDPAQVTHYYQFYYLKGVLSEIRKESPDKQLAYLLQAHHIRPDDYQVIRKIATIYFQFAIDSGNDQEMAANAGISFSYFKQYLRYLENDPVFHRENLKVLERNYLKNFPFLEKEIMEVKTDILNKLNYKRRLF